MRRAGLMCAVLLSAATLAAQRQAPPDNAPLALTNATVVNVRDGRVTPNATIVLRDGRIASIGAGPAPAGVRVLDLKGKYVMPGLIDAHTHADNLAAFRR